VTSAEIPDAFDPADPVYTIRTERLLLRPVGAADLDAMYEIFSDPEVVGARAWKRRAQAAHALERVIQGYVTGDMFRLAVDIEGRMVGSVTLLFIDRLDRRAEFGCALLPRLWGTGLMTEAMRAFLDLCFDTLHLRRIEADCDSENVAIIRVIEKLGFTREGRLRERSIVGGKPADSLLWGLLDREWRALVAR
jgi:RimJ/RimL family protein N-acetyltransferase